MTCDKRDKCDKRDECDKLNLQIMSVKCTFVTFVTLSHEVWFGDDWRVATLCVKFVVIGQSMKEIFANAWRGIKKGCRRAAEGMSKHLFEKKFYMPKVKRETAPVP